MNVGDIVLSKSEAVYYNRLRRGTLEAVSADGACIVVIWNDDPDGERDLLLATDVAVLQAYCRLHDMYDCIFDGKA